MRRNFVVAVTAALALAAGAQTADAKQAQERLDAYTAVVDAEGLAAIAEAGFDVGEGTRRVRGGTQVQLIMTAGQRAKLADAGVNATLTRVKGGQTVQQFAARMAVNGFNVWRSYDEDGGIEDQLRAAARNNPKIAKLEKIGRTIQGRDILALKLTEDAQKVKDGKRPAVLYSATQHAREWIAAEVNRRLMFHYINKWRSGDKSIRRLLEDNELWFILVANPDGYQYTFGEERLWRKNLRDNDGNGEITVGDGVDPNRNFPAHWKYDNEGSSSIFSSETYRGTQRGVRGRDEGDEGAARPHRLRVPGQLALGRPVAALRRGLAGRHGDGRRPDLLRAVGQPRRAGDRGRSIRA